MASANIPRERKRLTATATSAGPREGQPTQRPHLHAAPWLRDPTTATLRAHHANPQSCLEAQLQDDSGTEQLHGYTNWKAADLLPPAYCAPRNNKPTSQPLSPPALTAQWTKGMQIIEDCPQANSSLNTAAMD